MKQPSFFPAFLDCFASLAMTKNLIELKIPKR
jgi:hypothetical protein